MGYKRPKYGSRKVVLPNGQVFDSKREYSRFCELCDMENQGIIYGLRRQVPFDLIPQQKLLEPYEQRCKNGRTRTIRTMQGVKYFADFVYHKKDGELVVEDAKGMQTPEYKLKKKLMLYVHGIQIKEV